jgi:hypothetical protein
MITEDRDSRKEKKTMNRKIALVVVICLFGALLLTAAGPIPEKPQHTFTGTVVCKVTDEGTSDVKEKVHETNWGKKQTCALVTDGADTTGEMTLTNLWSDFNNKQNGAGYEVDKFRIKTADGTWKGYQVIRVNKEGVHGVNGWGRGESGPSTGQKIWYRLADDGVIHGWVSEPAPEDD